jgi:hypothetical protein
MARHALIDLTQIFSLKPVNDATDRLPPNRYEQLRDMVCQTDMNACRDLEFYDRLRDMRALYEGHAIALSNFFYMPLPPWIAGQPQKDNWNTVCILRSKTEAAGPSSDQQASVDRTSQTISPLADSHHEF